MKKTGKIYVAGHTGLIGSSLFNSLKDRGYKGVFGFTHEELDLTDRSATETMFRLYKPQYVFLAAAKVGSIFLNTTNPAEYIHDNLLIETNVIEAARKYGVRKLLFIAPSNIYPKDCGKPIKEESMMTGLLESTSSAYAMSKLTGIEMCKAYRKQWGSNFISVVTCTVYGNNDNFSLINSRVIPTFIHKFYEAKVNGIPQVELWGDGSPKREFIHVEDLSDALIFLMQTYNEPMPINVGSGFDVPISFIAKMVKDVMCYDGEIVWNKSYPNGTMRKLLDISKIKAIGWEPSISLEDGIKETYEWFVDNYNTLKK